ncbi:MAG: hypothetical protein RL088_4256 [Verrucomicrobiota bacterium]|jgi:hypothetical protein
MTRKRIIRKKRGKSWTPASSAKANAARWAADRQRRAAEEPSRVAELQRVAAENLPRAMGDALGCLQWTDYRDGQVRRWVVRIGDRADRITVEAPGAEASASRGWTWFLTRLRKHLSH